MMMIEETRLEINTIKEYSWDQITINFWVIKRSLKAGAASYTAKSMEIEGFEENFSSLAKNHIDRIDHISEYELLTADLDENDILVTCGEETDFSDILNKISVGSDADSISNIDDLNKAWGAILFCHTQLALDTIA